MDSGLFISFEGPEGGGKTTQISLLQSYLADNHYSVLVTRQPGGDPVGVELRKIMLDVGRENVCPRAELFMMMADRSQSVDKVILPHINAGGIVICDRYTDSSIAYQGGGRGIDIDWIEKLNDYATAGLSPDITFLLDIDPTIGLIRQTDRNIMELELSDFHYRVREAYLKLGANQPSRIKVINAAQSRESVHAEIRQLLEESGRLC